MTTVEGYSFFCEDIRWESNGSPIMLGVMSPTFSAPSYPINFSKLNLVSFFKASNDSVSYSAELTVKKIVGENEEIIGQFSADFTKDLDESSPYQWVRVAVLPLDSVDFDESDTLCAEVVIDGLMSVTYVTAEKPIEPPAIEFDTP